jgi:hypothetical protein
MDVIVRLSSEAAEALRHKPRLSGGLGEAAQKLESLGLTLEPLHSGAADQSLASWFRVPVGDPSTAEEIAQLLRGSSDVESAYVEPTSAAPG